MRVVGSQGLQCRAVGVQPSPCWFGVALEGMGRGTFATSQGLRGKEFPLQPHGL